MAEREEEERDVGQSAASVTGCPRSLSLGMQHCSWCSLGVSPQNHMNLMEAVKSFNERAFAETQHEQRVEGMGKWMQVVRTAQLCACIAEVQGKRAEDEWIKVLEGLQSQNMLGVLSWKPDELQAMQEEIWWIGGFVGKTRPPPKQKKSKAPIVIVGPSYEDAATATWRYEPRVPRVGIRIVEVQTAQETWTSFEEEARVKLLDFYDEGAWGAERLIEVEIAKNNYVYNYKIEGGCWMSQENPKSHCKRMVHVKLSLPVDP